MVRDLLSLMSKLRQISRGINVTSVDSVGRRETPLVTAARSGQADCVGLLLGHRDLLEVDAPDGQGRTALWHAVREEHFQTVVILVESADARVWYPDGDMACPLQMACKSTLPTNKVRTQFQFRFIFRSVRSRIPLLRHSKIP